MVPGEKLLFVSGILFCLVLITTAMMGGLLARYVVSDTAEDSARVAAFDVAALFAPEEAVTVSCAKNETEGVYILTVTSDSEVAVSYDILITLEKALPKGITAALYPQGEATSLTASETEDAACLSFPSAGTFPAGKGNSASYELKFTVDWSQIGFTKEASGNTASLELDFSAAVTITQLD